MLGNLLTWDEQRRKLELVVETAHKVWGNVPDAVGRAAARLGLHRA